jgi:hypothetical protein
MIYNVYVLSLMVSICALLSVWFDLPTEEEQALFGWAYWIVRLVVGGLNTKEKVDPKFHDL